MPFIGIWELRRREGLGKSGASIAEPVGFGSYDAGSKGSTGDQGTFFHSQRLGLVQALA